MENYINAQQEIVNRAAQISARQVIVFLDGALLSGGYRINGMRLSEELRERYNISIPKPDYVWTENPFLKGKVIGRPLTIDKAEEYPVLVGNVRDYRKYAGAFAKETHEELRKIKQEDVQVIWIPNKQGDTNLPTMVSCQFADKPEQCPYLTQAGDGMGMLMAPIKKEDDLSAEFRKVTSDVMYANHFEHYNIDADGIYQEVSNAPLDDYKIAIRYEGRTISVNKVVGSKIISNQKLKLSYLEIYLSSAQEAEPLDLQPIEKAIYLTMLLYSEKGVYIEKLETYSPKLDKDYKAFFDILIKIYENLPNSRRYENLPNSRRYDNSDNSDNSDIKHIRDLECILRSTFLRYKKNIKDKIAAQIKNTRLAQQFSIEGPRNGLNRIEKSTPELREEIRKIFSLL